MDMQDAILTRQEELEALLEAAEAEVERLTDDIAAYADDLAGVRRVLAFARGERNDAQAEVARLRAQVATLPRFLAVIYDLCQFNRDVGKGALLPPSLERDVLDALATTDNSGQDAVGG